jgi:predicted Zn-dependent protease
MAFDYAIEYIERAIGRPVFIRDRSLDARVVVRVEKDMWPTHGKWHKGKRGTSVLLGSHLEARPAPWIVTIILHELGHVLGLEHTEDQDSVMRPHHNVDDIPDERHPMFFSKDEIELLRRMHGAKEHRSWM